MSAILVNSYPVHLKCIYLFYALKVARIKDYNAISFKVSSSLKKYYQALLILIDLLSY